MTGLVRVLQRVSVDMDDDGLEVGDGAALVDLALLELVLSLPFVPFPGLIIIHKGVETVIGEVVWDNDAEQFEAHAEPIWAQTQDAAQGIVGSLVDGGFVPIDNHHRDKVH